MTAMDQAGQVSESHATPDLGSVPVRGEYEAERVTVDKDDTRAVGTMGELVDAWMDYLRAKEDQQLVLENVEEEAYRVMPHIHRWMPQYRRKTYAKFRSAEEWLGRKYGDEVPSTFITLTTSHTDENGQLRPPTEVLEELNEGWDKIRKIISKRLSGVDYEYIRVLEPHKSGYPHMHIAIFGVASPVLGDEVRERWVSEYAENAGKSGQDVEIQNGRDAQLNAVAGYLMKYMSKSLARDDGGDSTAIEAMPSTDGYKEFNSLLWLTDTRHFSMSQGITRAISEDEEDEDEESEWVFIGTVTGVDVGYYTGEKAERLGAYLAGSRNQQMPPPLEESRQERLPD